MKTVGKPTFCAGMCVALCAVALPHIAAAATASDAIGSF